MKNIFFAIAMLFVSSFGWSQSKWVMDKAHSSIQFSVTHLVISDVTGNFEEFEGSAIADNSDFEGADIEFSARIASITTDNEKRDSHLKSDDFFDAQQYPRLIFNGKLVKTGKDYKLKGDLTIRGETLPATFDVDYNGTITDPWGNRRAGFKITGMINRFDYGLNWNNLMETGGAVVGKDVEIVCNVELQKQA